MNNSQLIPEKNLRIFHSSYTVLDTGHDTPCWLWNKSLSDGYAQFWFKEYGMKKSKNHRGHRAAYKHFINPEIDDDMTLDHLCQVEACVNPYHCEEVTNAVNNQRKWEVIRLHEQRLIIREKE